MNRNMICDVPVSEEKLLETIAVSKSAFLFGESEQTVSRLDFLFLQSCYIFYRALRFRVAYIRI